MMTPETNHSDEADTAAMFGRLRDLKSELERMRVGKHQLAIVMIKACIVVGMNTRRRIVPALGIMGFNKRHVALTLAKCAGSDPTQHHWVQDESGVYTLHDDEPDASTASTGISPDRELPPGR